MSKRLDIEYCKNCEDVYASYANVWLCFENLAGESIYPKDTTFNCPRCGCLIARFKGFIEVLEKRDSPSFVDDVIAEISDLSDGSLSLLRAFLTNFTVPSFAVHFTGTPGANINELVKKRYLEVNKTQNGYFGILNAYKLGLFDNEEILLKMNVQSGFIQYPMPFKTNDASGKRRKARSEALINDFTDEDKAALLTRFNGVCALTGKDVTIQIDHVIPLAIGHGGTTKANMLPIWQRINSSKGAKNIFEWYEENGERFEVCPRRFYEAIEYLAELNDMTSDEYRDYVYECHANPNDILTEAII